MDSHALLTVGILSAIGFCSCQNELLLNGPLDGTVGGSVEFTLINPPSASPDRITWHFSGYREVIIFTSIGFEEDIHLDYEGRISVNKTTASLELNSLNQRDTGQYTVSLSISNVEYRGDTSLTVFEQISNVKAEANQNELVEFNSSVILTCSASGSSPSFRWFNRSAVVTGSDSKTLTVLNVTRYDTGPFQCEASNAISDQMSSDVKLNIAYGPDNAVVTVKPQASLYGSGSDITLSCSSESKPAAQFQWALNGTLLGREGPELRLENIQASQSGAYSCRAYNSKTHRSKTSSPSTITVLGFYQKELLLNGPLNGAVGGSVMFTLINPPPAPPNRISWHFSGNRDVTIFTSIGSVEDPHGDYVGRISVDKTTASLELRGLTHNDNGLYTVSISFSGLESRGETKMTMNDSSSLSAGATAGIVIGTIVWLLA